MRGHWRAAARPPFVFRFRDVRLAGGDRLKIGEIEQGFRQASRLLD
jgi:hypothetical protein